VKQETNGNKKNPLGKDKQMAWIIGLVTNDEIKKLKEIGWQDEDPPKELKIACDDLTKTRAFYVDSDVFSIMTGSDWEPHDPQQEVCE
jgi:hypothetical protein